MRTRWRIGKICAGATHQLRRQIDNVLPDTWRRDLADNREILLGQAALPIFLKGGAEVLQPVDRVLIQTALVRRDQPRPQINGVSLRLATVLAPIGVEDLLGHVGERRKRIQPFNWDANPNGLARHCHQPDHPQAATQPLRMASGTAR